jgi:hypothetical protein
VRRTFIVAIVAIGAFAASLAAAGTPFGSVAGAKVVGSAKTRTTTTTTSTSTTSTSTTSTTAAPATTTTTAAPTTTTTAAPTTTTTAAPTTTTTTDPTSGDGTTVSPPATSTTTTPAVNASAGAPPQRMFAYYYTWWSERHWQDKLGTSYPYAASPLPLPATLDASGCSAQTLYPGNQLIDVPTSIAAGNQDAPGVIENDVRTAASAGLAGFIVSWRGNGSATQTTADVSYSRRLAELVRAVDEINAEGVPFKIWISYKASDTILAVPAILGDFAYLSRTYASSGAFDRTWSSRPTIVWTGSKKYPLDTIRQVSEQYRGTFQLIGDETSTTWADGRAAYLDGDHYYWSSQNPYTNPGSFKTLSTLASAVRASAPNPDGTPKRWFAPLTPGYNSVLLGGSTCVPRNDGQTMRDLFAGNRQSAPDGWTFISWNEIAEGTFIVPMQRWGSGYLDVVRALTLTP